MLAAAKRQRFMKADTMTKTIEDQIIDLTATQTTISLTLNAVSAKLDALLAQRPPVVTSEPDTIITAPDAQDNETIKMHIDVLNEKLDAALVALHAIGQQFVATAEGESIGELPETTEPTEEPIAEKDPEPVTETEAETAAA